jgi:hypothetical protein
MTSTSIIMNAVSGTVSTIASLIILNIIRMSPQKLSTTYHRFMALMCVFDIMASVCMALTTLPMPSDDVLRFDGPMIGNKTTCQIQGYILLMGLTGGGSLYMCLSWYFVCKITFQMDSEKIRKIIEPISYIYCISTALFLPSYNLSRNTIDTAVKNSFCIISPMHSQCEYSIDKRLFVCDEGILQNLQTAYEIAETVIGISVFMIVIAMVIIIRTIVKKNKSIKQRALESTSVADPSSPTSTEHDVADSNTSDLLFSRVLVIQALMYIFANLMTWVFTMIPMMMNLDQNLENILFVFKAVFFPLQGFWNLIIFVYDKAYLVYQSEQEKGYWNAIKTVVFHPDQNYSGIILPPSLQVDEELRNGDDLPNTTEKQDNQPLSMDDPSSFDTSEDKLMDANAILRNMYRQQYGSSQAKENPMALIRRLHSMNYDSSGTRIHVPGSVPNALQSHAGDGRNVIEREGKRMVRVYLNPCKDTNLPDDDPYGLNDI